MIYLLKANIESAEKILELQHIAFKDLLDKYRDYDVNPGAENLNNIITIINQPFTQYYMIQYNHKEIGAVRIVSKENMCRISPMFIIPKYQGLGLAQETIRAVENLYDADAWTLDTILEEDRLCHLYEKMGYMKTGKIKKIKEGMHIVYYEKVRKNEL